MKSIKGYFHFSSTDFDKFNKRFKESLNRLQEDGLEVEVQYKTNVVGHNICYSCIMIGRVENKN